jgi:hypothetical protein
MYSNIDFKYVVQKFTNCYYYYYYYYYATSWILKRILDFVKIIISLQCNSNEIVTLLNA